MGKEAILAGLADMAVKVGKQAKEWLETDEGKAYIFGRYQDGTPRSFADCWNDETMSPKQRKRRMKQLKKRRNELEEMFSLDSDKKKSKKKKSKKKKKKVPKSWLDTLC